jgi:hypothetical protein
MDNMDTMDDNTCLPAVHTVHIVHTVHRSLRRQQCSTADRLPDYLPAVWWLFALSGRNAIVVTITGTVAGLIVASMNKRRDVCTRAPENFSKEFPAFFGRRGFSPPVMESESHACEQEQAVAYGRHH